MNKINIFFWSSTFFLGLLLGSCKKDDLVNKRNDFKIEDVTLISNMDSTVNIVNMGDWLAVHGTDSTNSIDAIKMIRFNDVVVDLKEVYVDGGIIYLQVPVVIPKTVDNKLVIKSGTDSTSFAIQVNIPSLELTRMLNEYARPGDTTTIYGKYFSLYETDSSNSIVYFGDKKSYVVETGKDFIRVKVPDDAGENVKVKLVNSAFSVEATCPGFYRDKNNVITTFDADFPYTGGTGDEFIGEWQYPKPTSGRYLRFEVTEDLYPDGLGWFYLIENSYAYTLDMMHHPEKYVLAFELNMLSPIKETKFFIYYYWAVAPEPIGGDLLNVHNFGVWETVRIPLERIIPMGNTGSDTNFSLNIRVEDGAPVEPVSMYFDNFRIYKKGT